MHPQVASAKEHVVDEYGQLHASGIHVPGRTVLNLWRQMQVGRHPTPLTPHPKPYTLQVTPDS